MPKYKIYKAFHAYQDYLDLFYSSNPSLKFASFGKQKNALIKDKFPWIFTWTDNIKDQDFEVFETVHNCEWLQKAWKKNKTYGSDWQKTILLEQIQELQPHICVIYPPEFFTDGLIEKIRNLVNHELLVIGYDGGLYRINDNLYRCFDVVITCSDYISCHYRDKGYNVYTLEFGFDESVLNSLNTSKEPVFDVGFSGSIYTEKNKTRYEFLKYLTNKHQIEIRSSFDLYRGSSLFSKSHVKLFLRERNLSKNLALWRIGNMNKGAVFGIDMFKFLNNCKIALNIHAKHYKFAANVRLYEVTGVGSCMLTDWKENLHNKFEIGKEIVVYRSFEEANDKIEYLLKNDSIREKIAVAGQKRTLECYSYEKRLSEMTTFLKNILN